MFGGMFPSFGHMTASPFDDMFNSAMGAMNSMQGATPPEGVHYSSWSQTRTMGPDGRVREETVQVGPGVDGRQETKRTVREGNASEMGSFGNQPFAPLLGENAADDQDVVVEEIHDDDSTGDAEVVRNVDDKEEDNGDRAQPPVSNWLKDRYNRWRSH